jgi:hypothetical protein
MDETAQKQYKQKADGRDCVEVEGMFPGSLWLREVFKEFDQKANGPNYAEAMQSEADGRDCVEVAILTAWGKDCVAGMFPGSL